MTVSDNERRLDVIERVLRDCISEHFCTERNGRVMDAVDRLNKTTAELQSTFREFQAERAAADRARARQMRTTLISVIMLGLSLIGAAVFQHIIGG